MATHDLVIRGGTVIDGSGSERFSADVAVSDGVITSVGSVDGSGREELDAAGALVTPGFVDIHTHYDGQATWSNRMAPSSHHGVTTVVMGNCGVGFAPVRPTDHDLLVELMEGVEDIPGVVLKEGVPWAWESFPEYMDYLAERQFDMDIGAQLPHAALRVYVMGQRGADREPATADDIAEMRRLTAEAIRAGAMGFSSSRTLNHRSSKGAPTPSLTAEIDEMVGIANGLKDAGGGVMEMISDFADLASEFNLLEDMVSSSGRPMTISLAQGLSPNGWRKILDRIDEASARGHQMRGQVAPRPIGIMFGLTASLTPFTGRPTFMALAGLPLAEKLAQLRDPEVRAKILSEAVSPGFEGLFKRMDEGRKLWELGDPPDYEPDPEMSLAARAERQGTDAFALAYDLLLENEGRTMLYSPFANYADGNLDCCRDMLLAENTVPGLGDGGAHVGIISDASFVTTLLAHWGRDRTRGERIPLETLVKRQSLDTARTVGLADRGLLAAGMKADINLIDFDNLRVRVPEMVTDLPSGGARLEQKADGYLATIVSGQVTYRNGEATEALPGRLIR
jgi:N-acyl-D-aspartate/D-glutamate deacylase